MTDENWPAAVDRTALGWLGCARHFRVTGLTPRLAKAIQAKAAALGFGDVTGLPDGPSLMLPVETPDRHQAADKLIAYIEGMGDVLSGEYGRADEPVEVSRADLMHIVGAKGGLFYGPGTIDVLARLREALAR